MNSMADDEDLLVDIEGEGQTEPEGEPNDAVDQLNRQLEALKADNKKRADAEARANQVAAHERARADAATREATEARATVADRELDTIVSGIAAAQAEAEAAEAAWAAAAEAGDFKKQAEANKKLSLATSRQTQLEIAKGDLETRRANLPGGSADVRRTEPVRSADPFEDHLRNFTPRTADWMREHREWVSDPRKNAKLIGAHHMAVGDGFAPDTDEYFAHVEKTLGIGQAEDPPPPQRNGAGNGQVKPARRVSPPVAPVNGSAGAHSSGAGENRGRNEVRLTAGEAKAATDGTIVWNKGNVDEKGEVIKEGDPRIGKPIGVQAYARRKQALEKGGYYDKSYTHG